MMESSNRRSTDKEKTPWHLNREISLTSIVTIFLLLGTWVYQFGVLNTKNLSAHDTLNQKIEILTADRVHKGTVDEMFRSRDREMSELKGRIDRLNDRVETGNDLLRQLVSRDKKP